MAVRYHKQLLSQASLTSVTENMLSQQVIGNLKWEVILISAVNVLQVTWDRTLSCEELPILSLWVTLTVWSTVALTQTLVYVSEYSTNTRTKTKWGNDIKRLLCQLVSLIILHHNPLAQGRLIQPNIPVLWLLTIMVLLLTSIFNMMFQATYRMLVEKLTQWYGEVEEKRQTLEDVFSTFGAHLAKTKRKSRKNKALRAKIKDAQRREAAKLNYECQATEPHNHTVEEPAKADTIGTPDKSIHINNCTSNTVNLGCGSRPSGKDTQKDSSDEGNSPNDTRMKEPRIRQPGTSQLTDKLHPTQKNNSPIKPTMAEPRPTGTNCPTGDSDPTEQDIPKGRNRQKYKGKGQIEAKYAPNWEHTEKIGDGRNGKKSEKVDVWQNAPPTHDTDNTTSPPTTKPTKVDPKTPTGKKAHARHVSPNQNEWTCTSKECTWPSCDNKDRTEDLTQFGRTRTLRFIPLPYLSQKCAPNVLKCTEVWCDTSWRLTGALCRPCLDKIYAFINDRLDMYMGPGICQKSETGCPSWGVYQLFCIICRSQLKTIIDRLQQGKCTDCYYPSCDEYRKIHDPSYEVSDILHASDANKKITNGNSGGNMSFRPCGIPVSRGKSMLCSKDSTQK